MTDESAKWFYQISKHKIPNLEEQEALGRAWQSPHKKKKKKKKKKKVKKVTRLSTAGTEAPIRMHPRLAQLDLRYT
jgi:hypothetical protein